MQKNILNTIFAFDLHGVVFRLSKLQITKELFTCPYKLKLFLLILYPKVTLKTLKELRNGAIAEEILFKLAKEFPDFKELLPTGFKIINAQKPILGTINIIKDLKAKGHKLFILSNIGEKSIKILQDSFPKIFSYFDGFQVSSAEDGYIKKPDLRFFDKYLNKFGQNKADIIFVDDRPRNINAALNYDIPSILFENPKQFYNKLKELGIMR